MLNHRFTFSPVWLKHDFCVSRAFFVCSVKGMAKRDNRDPRVWYLVKIPLCVLYYFVNCYKFVPFMFEEIWWPWTLEYFHLIRNLSLAFMLFYHKCSGKLCLKNYDLEESWLSKDDPICIVILKWSTI